MVMEDNKKEDVKNPDVFSFDFEYRLYRNGLRRNWVLVDLLTAFTCFCFIAALVGFLSAVTGSVHGCFAGLAFSIIFVCILMYAENLTYKIRPMTSEEREEERRRYYRELYARINDFEQRSNVSLTINEDFICSTRKKITIKYTVNRQNDGYLDQPVVKNYSLSFQYPFDDHE